MTAELWLMKRCPHGAAEPCDGDECPGGSRVWLNPDQVVFTIPNDMWGSDDEFTVQDVIDALEE